MTKPELIGSIEISQDLEFQRKSWRVQRIGWVVMLVIVIAALLGLFGDGPLSSAEAGNPESGLTVRYERFTRMGARHVLDVEIASAQVEADSAAQLWIDRSWHEANQVRSIVPEPARSAVVADRIVYSFDAPASAASIMVRFELEARSFGWIRARAGLANGPSLSFGQLAYP